MPKLLLQQHCCFTKHPWKTGCFQNTFFYSYILVCFKTTGYWPLDERCAHQSRTGWWCQSCRNVCHAKAETLAASCHISAWRAVSTNINGTQIIHYLNSAIQLIELTTGSSDRWNALLCHMIEKQHVCELCSSTCEVTQALTILKECFQFHIHQGSIALMKQSACGTSALCVFQLPTGQFNPDRWLLGLVASMACHEFALRSPWVSAMPFETFPILALKSTTSTWTGKKLEVMLLTSRMVVETASGTF